MTVDLELSVLLPSSDELGYITGLAITDQLLVAAGGTSGQHPTMLATSNVRHFEPRKTPRELGLRDVLVVSDDVFWVCGEYGQLAVSRDRGETWRVLDTGTDACLYALALAPDHAIWTVGSDGYVARVVGERSGEGSSAERYTVERVDMQTTARLTALYAVRDEMIALGHDGAIYRSRAGVVARIATGSTLSLNALAITKNGTWLAIGDGGFIARSPDGAWFSRVRSGLELDLEAITTLADGRIVMVGDRGAILMSTDDGRTWKSFASDLTAHLWSVERFGEGVVIGGDEGLIVKLAPADDQTWEDRINVFGGVKPLDAVFAGGPAGFIGRGLSAYLDAVAGTAAAAAEGAAAEAAAAEEEEEGQGQGQGQGQGHAHAHAHAHGEHVHSHAHGDHGHSHAHGDHTHAHGDHTHSHAHGDHTHSHGDHAHSHAHGEHAHSHDDDDDDDDGLEHEPVDPEAFEALEPRGTVHDFERNYGVRMPVEAAGFFAAVEGRDKWSSFEELRLDTDLLPDVGDKNLFELLVRRDQQAYLGTGLIEAFCGVFGIGSQGNGDTYHMEVHELDGPRQVLHYDHETHAFTGVVADSLDSLVNLAALKHARSKRLVSDEVFEIGLRKLRGKVAPTWHFSITDDDPDFVPLDPKRRDTEFFFYRSRWITALLENNGVTEISDLPRMFMADFNQVVPQDQLAARFEACERFIPTALYSIWRAFLFDEPELARYLDIGRRHKARLVRDAATLVDELRAGRNQLGTITDVRAYLAEFRALDLDPRRAEQRKAEAEERARVEALRTAEVEDELSRVPRTSWSDLAWRWLGDGVAHRALLQKLDAAPITAVQIAALDELRHLADDERELVIARLATELTPELEAVLVGSLVRGDDLSGVLPLPEELEVKRDHEGADHEDEEHEVGTAAVEEDADDEAEDEADDDEVAADDADVDDEADDDEDDEDDEDAEDDEDGDRSAGWDAIDAALEPIYKGDEPHGHYGTVVPYMLGGNDPIHGISVYLRTLPVPHFHFVTYGFTDLFEKETDDPEVSGFGFELTLRLARVATDETVPAWALNFLQNLARYVFGTGNRFAVGHKMGLNGPIAVAHDTQLTAVLFADDPELGEFASEFGSARFLQVVGITDDEYKLIQEWSTTGLVDILRRKLPFLVTDLGRDSVLADPVLAEEVHRRVDEEGSSEELTFAGDMELDIADAEERVRITMGALYASALPRAMRGRLRHGRAYTLRGRSSNLELRPGETCGYELEEEVLVVTVTPVLVAELEARLREALAGTYRFESWLGLEVVVVPSVIRDQAGRAIEVRGVEDPAERRRIIEEENARADAESVSDAESESESESDADADVDVESVSDAESDDDDESDAEYDDEEDDDEEDDDDDERPPDPAQVRAALAMTARALLIAPEDDETQFTHAMLVLDADRVGMAGKLDSMLAELSGYTASNRINIVVRMGRMAHPRFAEALDAALVEELPERIFGESSREHMVSYGDVAEELFSELGEIVLEHAPDHLAKLVPLLPPNVNLLSTLAFKAVSAKQPEDALALYERLLDLPIPDEGTDRTNYLRALNNGCVQAHAAKAFDVAVRIADRAQPFAHENPYIYHSAACAYSAIGNYNRAFEQVKLAVTHEYEHLGRVEVDADLGPILEWPEFKALFRDWHTRQEGN